MRSDFLLCALVGMASASVVIPRQDGGYPTDDSYAPKPDPYKADPYKADPYKPDGYPPSKPADGYGAKPPPYKPDGYGAKPPPYKPDGYKPYPQPKPTDDGYGSKPIGYKPDGYPPSKPADGYGAKPPPYKPDGYKPLPPPKPTDDGYPTKWSDYGHKPSDDGYPAKWSEDDYASKPGYTPKPPKYDSGYPSDDDDEDKYSYVAEKKGYSTKPYKQGSSEPWHPKTSHPEFFSVRVDEKCNPGDVPATCPFDNYAIRLEQGIVIATPYNKWWDPKLPIFFVDDDTQLYTVSKKPLQLYVDTVTGALRYAAVGWLPPNAIAFSFYKTGTNPLGNVDPSPAHLSWPSTQGNTLFGDGPWNLCALGNTGQYQVFVSNENYEGSIPAGVYKDPGECSKRSLAAINASPWKSGPTS